MLGQLDQPIDQPDSPDDQRLKVMQALLAQKAGGSGPMAALAQIAQAYAGRQIQQRAAENRQNSKLGANPISPAFDDQGYAMPRAPGMAQPTALQTIQNFFTRGTG